MLEPFPAERELLLAIKFDQNLDEELLAIGGSISGDTRDGEVTEVVDFDRALSDAEIAAMAIEKPDSIGPDCGHATVHLARQACSERMLCDTAVAERRLEEHLAAMAITGSKISGGRLQVAGSLPASDLPTITITRRC